ncbi:fimbrial protein, partial [Klebsiella sp. DNRA6]|nr:fimbrial protein [Klebsiella sp. DNRA6]
MLTEETQMLPVTAVVRRIVVFLPDTPALLLTTLQHAAVLLEQANEPLPMLLLSRRSKASWLWQTLVHQVS